MKRDFKTLFPVPKPVIGMIHLAGKDSDDKLHRALEEMRIYNDEGVDGFIIEDYHGTVADVINVAKYSRWYDVVRGINILGKPFETFVTAAHSQCQFIQLDSVQTPDLALQSYNQFREEHPDLVVLGGVGFKYTKPTGNSLEKDLAEGMSRCEAIVTTGEGTGIETPIRKLRNYRRIMGDFPLISGAGVTAGNVYEQLQVADGIIVGSYFKPEGNTQLKVDRTLVKKLMDAVRDFRGN